MLCEKERAFYGVLSANDSLVGRADFARVGPFSANFRIIQNFRVAFFAFTVLGFTC